MKAVVCTKAGKPDVLEFRDVKKPVPKENELLVKVFASTVTRGDIHLRKIPRFVLVPLGIFLGFKAMKITGIEFSGEVEQTGNNVTLFRKGDQIFGTTTGLKFGANAEYVCVPEKRKTGVVALKPKNLSFSDSAAVPVGGMTAWHNLKKADIKQGHKVLVYGASGSVGSYAVQIAKYFGAEVTGVCSKDNIGMVKSLGADKIIDYTNEDFSKTTEMYDIIFDAVGKITKSRCRNILKKTGRYFSVKYPTSEKTEYLHFLTKLIEEGKLKPFIDKSFPLEKTTDAHLYVEQGHKKGNVIISMEGNHEGQSR